MTSSMIVMYADLIAASRFAHLAHSILYLLLDKESSNVGESCRLYYVIMETDVSKQSVAIAI